MADPVKNFTTSIEPDQTAKPADPFDLTNLRLDQSFVESAGVKKLLTTVPVRKPNPQDFVRVHPNPEYQAVLAVIELKDDRELYLVLPSVARELSGEFAMATIYTAINRQGVLFLWPVRLPAPDGRILEWHRSASEAADLAMRPITEGGIWSCLAAPVSPSGTALCATNRSAPTASRSRLPLSPLVSPENTIVAPLMPTRQAMAGTPP